MEHIFPEESLLLETNDLINLLENDILKEEGDINVYTVTADYSGTRYIIAATYLEVRKEIFEFARMEKGTKIKIMKASTALKRLKAQSVVLKIKLVFMTYFDKQN